MKKASKERRKRERALKRFKKRSWIAKDQQRKRISACATLEMMKGKESSENKVIAEACKTPL